MMKPTLLFSYDEIYALTDFYPETTFTAEGKRCLEAANYFQAYLLVISIKSNF